MSTISLSELRRTLREQFPAAHQDRPRPDTDHLPGLPPLPKGSLIELVTPLSTSGATLLLSHLLENAPPHPDQNQLPLVLIDPSSAFDPCAYSPIRPLLWLRARNPQNALKAADLLLRDGNLPLLILDLALTPLTELRPIPSSSWYRLRTLAETSGTSLLTLTPRPLITAAPIRHQLQNTLTLQDLHQLRRDLLPHLTTRPLHQNQASNTQ